MFFRESVIFWFGLISIATITHSLYRLFLVSQGVDGASFENLLNPGQHNDAGYVQYSLISYIHIIPGMIFVIFGPIQFWQKFRRSFPVIHKVCGYIYIVSLVAVVLTAWQMAYLFPVGGLSELIVSSLFGLIALFCVFRAFWHIKHKQIIDHRAWMLRGYFIVMGIGTVRFIIPLFVATGLVPLGEGFAISMWVSFVLHAILAEIWISSVFRIPKVVRSTA